MRRVDGWKGGNLLYPICTAISSLDLDGCVQWKGGDSYDGDQSVVVLELFVLCFSRMMMSSSAVV